MHINHLIDGKFQNGFFSDVALMPNTDDYKAADTLTVTPIHLPWYDKRYQQDRLISPPISEYRLYVFQSTPDNQLFLSNTKSTMDGRPILTYCMVKQTTLSKSLSIIRHLDKTGGEFEKFMVEFSDFIKSFNEVLRSYDQYACNQRDTNPYMGVYDEGGDYYHHLFRVKMLEYGKQFRDVFLGENILSEIAAINRDPVVIDFCQKVIIRGLLFMNKNERQKAKNEAQWYQQK